MTAALLSTESGVAGDGADANMFAWIGQSVDGPRCLLAQVNTDSAKYWHWDRL